MGSSTSHVLAGRSSPSAGHEHAFTGILFSFCKILFLLKSNISHENFKIIILGFVSNELTLGIPPHMLDLCDFRDHLEALAAEYGISIRTDLTSSADEMELFGAVNRQFKRLFNMQEECRTFYQYDCVPEGEFRLFSHRSQR